MRLYVYSKRISGNKCRVTTVSFCFRWNMCVHLATTMEYNRSWATTIIKTRNSQTSEKPEYSLPCLQEPATGPYSEQYESSLVLYPASISILILSYQCVKIYEVSHRIFRQNIRMHFLSLPCVLYANRFNHCWHWKSRQTLLSSVTFISLKSFHPHERSSISIRLCQASQTPDIAGAKRHRTQCHRR